MKRVLLILVLGLMMFTGCYEKDLDMTVMQQTRYEGATINEITVEDAWSVQVLPSDSSYVELEYCAFLEEYLQIRMEGTALYIGLSRSLRLPNNTVMHATIHTASVQKLHFSDAVVASLGRFPETALTLELEDAAICRNGYFYGTADLKLSDASKCVEFSFEGTDCTVELDDASVLQAKLNVSGNLTMTIKEASRVTEYWGEINHADVRVLDASQLNMATSTINTMYIDVNSVSEATVNVVEFLEGLVHNASKLYYSGDPILNVDCDETSILQQVDLPNPSKF